MSPCDRCGLPISTPSDAAAAAYREGLDLMLSAWPGAVAEGLSSDLSLEFEHPTAKTATTTAAASARAFTCFIPLPPDCEQVGR